MIRAPRAAISGLLLDAQRRVAACAGCRRSLRSSGLPCSGRQPPLGRLVQMAANLVARSESCFSGLSSSSIDLSSIIARRTNRKEKEPSRRTLGSISRDPTWENRLEMAFKIEVERPSRWPAGPISMPWVGKRGIGCRQTRRLQELTTQELTILASGTSPLTANEKLPRWRI